MKWLSVMIYALSIKGYFQFNLFTRNGNPALTAKADRF
jgi:hypothetical protein